MTDEQLVVVFTKAALPGSVKTRLVPPFTAEEAAEFHLASLADLVSTASRAAGVVELHVAGDEDDVAEVRALYPDHRVARQAEGRAGERLAVTFDRSFQRAYRRVLILASHCPTIPHACLAAAFDHLEHADLALGPTRDGGYYCVAVRRASWPAARAIFRLVPWSTLRFLDRTLERARDIGLTVGLAPQWYEVERPEDLQLVGRDAPPNSAALSYLKTLWRRSGGCCAP